MAYKKSDLIVRLPRQVNRWIGIDELKKIPVDIVDPVQGKKMGRVSLDLLLRKMR